MKQRRLIVNLESIAALRRAREGAEPDPVGMAQLALLGGAEGVGITLREDRRDALDRDARLLRQTVHRELWLAVAANAEMLKLVLEIRPDVACLTPDTPPSGAAGGLDVQTRLGPLGDLVRTLEDGKVAAVLSIRGEIEQVKAAHRVGAWGVELHAARFAEGGPDRDVESERMRDAARLARKLGMHVAVGRGLDERSIRPLAALDEIQTFHVGHAVATRALGVGMERAVVEMRALL